MESFYLESFILSCCVSGYVGTDFFTYRMMIGSVLTSPATIAINVVEHDSVSPDKLGQFLDGGDRVDSKAHDIETGSGGNGGKGGGKKKNKNEMEIEMTSANEMSKNAQQRGKAGTSFMQVLMNKTSGTKNAAANSENGDAASDDESEVA